MSLNALTKPLKKGDEVVTVAASSAIEDKTSLEKGIEVLESWGLISRPQEIEARRWGYLAGNDESRRKDLEPIEIAPLFACARGGWGAARLLESRIKWQPGWLLGFSDVTSLLWARYAAGFDGCVHGPLITTLGEEPPWSKERLRKLLFGEPVPDLTGTTWRGGNCKGKLVVANLTVATHLLGTNYVPNLKGAILLFEDVGEAPYRIDRMLTQWRLAGGLNDLAGIGFGEFKGCVETESISDEETFQVEQVLIERTSDLGIPVIGNFPIGHCSGNAALPIGREAILNGDLGRLSLSF